MSEEPQNPAEAARALWEIDQNATAVRLELKVLRKKLPALNKVHRVTYARALLESEGPMDVRKQQAVIASADALFAKEACEQEMEACKDHLWEFVRRAENVRAINSNLKEEIRTFGSRYET